MSKAKLKAVAGQSAAKIPTKKAYCKEPGCFDNPQTKGFCRLHFIKHLSAKTLKADDDFEELREAAKNRRRSNRLQNVDSNPAINEEQLSRESERLSELDLDLDEMDIETIVKKTG